MTRADLARQLLDLGYGPIEAHTLTTQGDAKEVIERRTAVRL